MVAEPNGQPLLFARAGVMGVEEAGCVVWGQNEGEMPDPGIVGGPGQTASSKRCARSARGRLIRS
jgi:hypothetical protein